MTAAPALIQVPSSQLSVGDVVVTHGMRILIDRPIRSYTPEPVPEGMVVMSDVTRGGTASGSYTVYATCGLVTNVDEVKDAGVVPVSFLERDGDDYRWTIQGNDLARWYVIDACPTPTPAA